MKQASGVALDSSSLVAGENGIHLPCWVLVMAKSVPGMMDFPLPLLSSLILGSRYGPTYPFSHLAEDSSCTRVSRPAYPMGAGHVGERIGQFLAAYRLPRPFAGQAVEEKTEYWAPTFQ